MPTARDNRTTLRRAIASSLRQLAQVVSSLRVARRYSYPIGTDPNGRALGNDVVARPRWLGPAGPACGDLVAKYDPLRDYLAGQRGDEVQMTFSEVERLVGDLPDSARIHRA